MAISDESYDDLADMLAYFGYESVASQPQAVAEPLAQEPTAAPEPEFLELTPSIPLGWTSIRRPSFDFESVLDFPEPVPDFQLPDTEPDLFQDKIERLVDVAKIGSRDERDEYRQLLADYPVYTSRVEIQRQIDEGLSPRQIRLNARIRRRFESVALEFNKQDLWGLKYVSYNQQYLSWRLADQFRRAHLTSRAQLFQFFRQLNDRFEQASELRGRFRSLVDLAAAMLPQRALVGGVDHGPLSPNLWRQRLARAGLGQTWRWQSHDANRLSRRGLPLRQDMIEWVRPQRVSTSFFDEYRVSRNGPRLWTGFLEEAGAYVLRLVAVESPVSMAYLVRRYHQELKLADLGPLPWSQVLAEIEPSLAYIGPDLWFRAQSPRAGRRPRIGRAQTAPTLVDTSVYDLGLGFQALKASRPDLQVDELELAFLRLWRADESQLDLLRNKLKSYAIHYAKDANLK